MAIKLPPKFTNVPAQDLFDTELPDSVFRTLAQIHGLAWQTRGEHTPPTTVLELAALRGLKERQMYNHLRQLKAHRRIRVENLGHGRIVIYPLRRVEDPGAALPATTSLTEAELAALSDEPGPAANGPPDAASTAKNCSGTAIERSQHVVVDHFDSDATDSQQQHADHTAPTAKNCSAQIAGIFIADGDPPAVAQLKATRLIEQYGLERCLAQLRFFPRRCELARASEKGLLNPSGLFIRSVKENYSPPPQRRRRWYTQEEYERYFQH